MSGVLPWEFNSDINFSESNRTAVNKTLIPILQEHGLILEPTEEGQAAGCVDSSYRPCYILDVPNSQWKLELYSSRSRMPKELAYLKRKKFRRTKVLLHGDWLPSQYNPGLYLLEKYGSKSNIYKHLEHESVLRGNRARKHKHKNSGFFNKCLDRQNKQACLDQLSPDGNIQFLFDPVPS